MPILRRDALILLGMVAAGGGATGQDAINAATFTFGKPDGGILPLADFAGRPILIVNTATSCGLAPHFPVCRPCGPVSATVASR